MAISYSDVQTLALIGAGSLLEVSGDIQLTANQDASTITIATGDANSDTAAVGIALALTVADHLIRATTLRDVLTPGALAITVSGASVVNTETTASAGGAPEKDGSSDTPADTISSATQFLSDTTGSSSPPNAPVLPAGTAGGDLAVAAAISVTVH